MMARVDGFEDLEQLNYVVCKKAKFFGALI